MTDKRSNAQKVRSAFGVVHYHRSLLRADTINSHLHHHDGEHAHQGLYEDYWPAEPPAADDSL